MALTVGVGTVMDAREVLVIITGTRKAYALYKCIEEGVNHMWTVSALQLHPRACIVCDKDATQELKVRTVEYFRGIQETMETLVRRPMEGYAGTMIRPVTASPLLPHGVPGSSATLTDGAGTFVIDAPALPPAAAGAAAAGGAAGGAGSAAAAAPAS